MPVKFKKSAGRCADRTLPYAMATKDTLTCYLPRSEVHSTCNFYYFLWLQFADLGNWGHPTVWLYTCPYPCKIHCSHTSSHVCPTLTSSSPHPRRASPHHLPTFFSVPQSFPSNSNEKVVSALYFWDHHTLTQIVAKPTEALEPAWRSAGTQVMKIHHNLLPAS